MQWPFLKSCVNEGVLEPIALIYAERLLAQTDCSLEEVAAFVALMMASFVDGHLCFNIEMASPNPKTQRLYDLARRGIDQIPLNIHQVLQGDELMPLKPMCSFNGNFYFQKNWVFETQFLQQFLRLAQTEPRMSIASKPASSLLNPEQQQAIALAIHSSVSLIIGGPGTGKTFTAKHLVQQCLEGLSREERKKFRIVLAAPTGKAATHLEKQIASALGEEDRNLLRSGTLHALLQLREDGTQKTEVAVLADLIIVDECSMIDAKLNALLLSAIPSGTRLVLIGDKDQLPAVDAGSFFADLIDAGCPAVTLKQARRVENDQLAELADAIYRGEISEMNQKFSPFIQHNTDSLEKSLWEAVDASYPAFFTTPPNPQDLLSHLDRFRILSCLRQGPLGVDVINRSLLQSYQSRLPHVGWWAIPIIVTRNDTSSQLYNGDTGILVRKIDPARKKMSSGQEDYAVFIDRKPVPALALPPFEYAYCLSVHKSQGSEYDRITLLVPEGSERFGKEILYTAVTRARQGLEVYAQFETLENMVRKSSRKISGLTVRLQRAHAGV